MFGRRGVLKEFGSSYSELQDDVGVQSHAPNSQGPNVAAARQAAYLRLHGKRPARVTWKLENWLLREALQAAIQAALLLPPLSPLRLPLPVHRPDSWPSPRPLGPAAYRGGPQETWGGDNEEILWDRPQAAPGRWRHGKRCILMGPKRTGP